VNGGSISGVVQVFPTGGPEVKPFDGMREVVVNIPTHSGAVTGGGAFVATHIRSYKSGVGG
jgi:hypothetical protein